MQPVGTELPGRAVPEGGQSRIRQELRVRCQETASVPLCTPVLSCPPSSGEPYWPSCSFHSFHSPLTKMIVLNNFPWNPQHHSSLCQLDICGSTKLVPHLLSHSLLTAAHCLSPSPISTQHPPSCLLSLIDLCLSSGIGLISSDTAPCYDQSYIPAPSYFIFIFSGKFLQNVPSDKLHVI